MIITKIAEQITITLLAIAFVRFLIIAIGRENEEAYKDAEDAELGLMKSLREGMSLD